MGGLLTLSPSLPLMALRFPQLGELPGLWLHRQGFERSPPDALKQ